MLDFYVRLTDSLKTAAPTRASDDLDHLSVDKALDRDQWELFQELDQTRREVEALTAEDRKEALRAGAIRHIVEKGWSVDPDGLTSFFEGNNDATVAAMPLVRSKDPDGQISTVNPEIRLIPKEIRGRFPVKVRRLRLTVVELRFPCPNGVASTFHDHLNAWSEPTLLNWEGKAAAGGIDFSIRGVFPSEVTSVSDSIANIGWPSPQSENAVPLVVLDVDTESPIEELGGAAMMMRLEDDWKQEVEKSFLDDDLDAA